MCAFFIGSICGTAKSLYVSPNGSDSNIGSFQQPFQTIQHAIDTALPYDAIYIRAGSYDEAIVFDNKQHLSLQPYEQERAILDGTNRTGDDQRAISIENSSHITIQQMTIQHYSASDPNIYPAGIVITDGSQYISLHQNQIIHIRHTHPDGNAHGILVYGNALQPIAHVAITENELAFLELGNSESLTLSGNVTNFQVTGNYLHHNNNIGIDIAGHYAACDISQCEDVARFGRVAYNVITQQSAADNASYPSDGSAPGIYVDGGAYVNVAYNIVTHNDYGVSIGSENAQKYSAYVTLHDNYIAHNRKAGLVIGGSDLNNGGARALHVVNNRFIQNDTVQEGYGDITLQQHMELVAITHNQFFSRAYYLNEQYDTTPSYIVHRNDIVPFSTSMYQFIY